MVYLLSIFMAAFLTVTFTRGVGRVTLNNMGRIGCYSAANHNKNIE